MDCYITIIIYNIYIYIYRLATAVAYLYLGRGGLISMLSRQDSQPAS